MTKYSDNRSVMQQMQKTSDLSHDMHEQPGKNVNAENSVFQIERESIMLLNYQFIQETHYTFVMFHLLYFIYQRKRKE